MKKILSLFTLILLVQWTFAVDPSTNLATYYANIDGKATDSNDNLRKTLCTIISNGYTTIGYSSLPNSVYAASSNPSDFYNGSGSSKTMEDIYSSYPYNSSQDGSSATTCGTGWNKEHTVPQSWFGKESPMVSDAHHVFPTDIRMNSCRSNYPYGENNASKYCSSYGYGHLGTSTFSGYTGQVFDPGSKEDCGGKCYRGDLARVYFYMATRYRTTNFTSGTGGTSFTYTNGVADLTDYMKNLMLKWHREDPVSEKELIRNNAIYAHQKNRNPFVDYPCLAEYIWGDKKGEAVSLSSLISGYVGVGTDCCSSEPTLTVSSSSITIGPIATSSSTTQTFTVTGANLTGSISITKNSGSSSYITVSPTSITSGYNGTNPITITYNAPASAGTHTATLTISSTGATPVTVNITASCAASCTATWMADGSTFGTSTAASGASPELPALNPSNCTSSRVFVGWTDNGSYNGDGSDLFTDEAPTMTTDKTFFAVYADEETSGGGASGSVTITTSTTNIPTSYGSANTFTEYTLEGYKFQIQQMYLNSGKLQWRAAGNASGTGTMYNSGTFPGKISSIVLTYNSSDGNKNFTLNVGSSANPTSGTSITPTSSGLVYTFNCSSQNADYFVLTNGSGAGYLDQIVINYSGSTTTYSNYSTQCTACTPVAATASYAYPTRTTTCGGSVSNTFTTNSNATVSYTSSNETVATVASDGTVTPVGAGTATITATVPANTCYTGGASASFTLTVNRTSTSASFVSPTTTVGVGSSVTNTVTTESDGTVTYSSDNTSVATVNSSGQVTGKVAGTATITANIAQSSCYNATSASYTITVEAAPEYTVTFMNMGGTHATCTGTAGSAISAVSDPTACNGYTFEGWSTLQYAVDNTGTPSLSTPTTIPVGGATYYAVYSKTEGSGSSSTSEITASTTLVSGSTSGYTFATGKNGGSSNPTYNSTGRDVRLYAKNQITISASSTITQIVFNLSTQGEKRLAPITASEGTIATQNSGDNKVTWTGSATSVTFTVGDKATYGGDGASKAGQLCFTSVNITSGSGSSTTYHTTAPDCSCTATITATSNDDSMGTASVTTP
ncbi:MAG: endonuclease [Paludibacteraceae bacterium]|nr:endonuclease [Paludibacteraceae bacterium]